jgi:chromosome segregation protein
LRDQARRKAEGSFIEEDVQREFQVRVGTYDWRALLWRSDDEPADLKQLDLDEDEDEGSAPAAALAGTAASPVVTSPEAVSASGAEGIPVDPAAAAVTSAPATTSRRRKKKGPKPEPTEDDLKSLETGTDWAPLKTEIEALRQRLASMGAVNLVAIEEYAELKQRYDFLKNQNDDLVQAKTSLLAMIDEINQTSQQQFSVTFEQIKKNFVYTFQTLFGGGVANLELIQTEDVLESGIEITAQPPGTKLKSITLLSGGQKTLTAVALLFALYMVKPSPFCSARRVRRSARRVEHRALHGSAEEIRERVAVHHHHPQQAHGFRRAGDLRGDDGGARRLEDRLDAVQSPRGRT